MTGYEFCEGYWWIFPLVMFFFCFLIMGRGCRRWVCRWGSGYGIRESALDVLKKRYAKGEIDQNEYQEKKEELLQK